MYSIVCSESFHFRESVYRCHARNTVCESGYKLEIEGSFTLMSM